MPKPICEQDIKPGACGTRAIYLGVLRLPIRTKTGKRFLTLNSESRCRNENFVLSFGWASSDGWRTEFEGDRPLKGYD
jgi:hypothetical protein